jgi:hypothetical protein
VAAAALAAVVASPFVVDDLRSGPGPTPAPATQVPTPSATPPEEAKKPGRVVVRRQSADVDGDGRADRVELRFRTGRSIPIMSARVTVTLADGRTSSDATGTSGDAVLDTPRDMNGDGRQVIVTRSETGDADIPQIFAFRQGRIQHLATAYHSPSLVNSVDAEGRVIRFWWDDQDRLFSVQGVTPTRHNRATVEVFRWTVRPAPGNGPVLGATRLPGTRCFDLERSAFGTGC